MKIKKGDFGYIIPVKLLTATYAVFNLAGYTAKMKVWAKGTPGSIKWTLDGSVTDAAAGEVEFTVANTHFTEVGIFKGEIEIARAGHIESSKSFTVEIEESPE